MESTPVTGSLFWLNLHVHSNTGFTLNVFTFHHSELHLGRPGATLMPVSLELPMSLFLCKMYLFMYLIFLKEYVLLDPLSAFLCPSICPRKLTAMDCISWACLPLVELGQWWGGEKWGGAGVGAGWVLTREQITGGYRVLCISVPSPHTFCLPGDGLAVPTFSTSSCQGVSFPCYFSRVWQLCYPPLPLQAWRS